MTTTENLTPIYKDVKFDTKEAFEKWLDETTKYEIVFFDDGQDLIKFYVAENNEIINADYGAMSTIYSGCFIVEEPIEFGSLKIYNPKYQPEPYYLKFTISEIIKKEGFEFELPKKDFKE